MTVIPERLTDSGALASDHTHNSGTNHKPGGDPSLRPGSGDLDPAVIMRRHSSHYGGCRDFWPGYAVPQQCLPYRLAEALAAANEELALLRPTTAPAVGANQ